MLIEDVRPTTIVGVKRLATQFKKTKQIKRVDALELAAQAADCESYKHALRTLPRTRGGGLKPYVLLTIYWYDKESRPSLGRETLRVELSRPLLDLCEKRALRYARGFGNLRMVADDHFVCDDLAHSQDYARGRLCTAEHSLRFIEFTGLIPNRDRRKYPRVLDKEKLPNADHSTNWMDPETGQFVLVDEPYGNVPNEEKRSNWATRNGWSIAKSNWPGMHAKLHICPTSGRMLWHSTTNRLSIIMPQCWRLILRLQ